MRAHMNCVENLPVYGGVAIAAALSGVQGRDPDGLALMLLAARIAQSLVHIALTPTEAVVALRFALFLLPIASMVMMGILVAVRA